MAAAYSLDLRERVVASVGSGLSRRAAAERFQISVSTAETGSPAARPMGGKRPFALAAEADWVLARLREKPDITLTGLLAELHARGVKVSYYGVWHFVTRAGLSFKKKPARQRTGSPRCGATAGALVHAPGQA